MDEDDFSEMDEDDSDLIDLFEDISVEDMAMFMLELTEKEMLEMRHRRWDEQLERAVLGKTPEQANEFFLQLAQLLKDIPIDDARRPFLKAWIEKWGKSFKVADPGAIFRKEEYKMDQRFKRSDDDPGQVTLRLRHRTWQFTPR